MQDRSSPSYYIGKIVKVRIPAYNARTSRMEFKARPALVIAVERDNFPCDFTVLPISKVSKSENIDEKFDIKLEEKVCNNLLLTYVPSYLRTHKIFTVNNRNMDRAEISDFKVLESEIYAEAEENFKVFVSELF